MSDEKNASNITENISEAIKECKTKYTDSEKSDIPKVNHGKLPVSHGNFTTKKDKKLLVCKYEGCCASYIYKKSFKIHLLTHNHNKTENIDMKSNNILPAVCETCGETFKTEIYLYNHNRNFHRQFKCKECKEVGINFTTRNNTQLFIQ